MYFDPRDPKLRQNPYPIYAQMHEKSPLYYFPDWGMWFVFSYADCAAILREPGLGRSEMQLAFLPKNQTPIRDMLSRWLFLMDPPDHTRLRGLIHKAFSPHIVQRLRASINALANQLLDQVQDQRQMDLINDFAYPLPIQVICTLLGVPAEDHLTFRVWTEGLARALDLNDDKENFVCASIAATAMTDYLDLLSTERKRHPKDDLLSALVAVEEQGDRLSREELFATCGLLLMAGHETTAHMIGNGTLAMLRSRSQWELLVAQPQVAESAVEEVMRYDAPVQVFIRLVQEEFTHREITFKVGQQISFVAGAAHRDPAHFANPQHLDITRQNTRHFGFGTGIHYCLGAPLARMEGAIAFATLSRRFPNLALQDAPLTYRGSLTMRGLEKLLVTL